jgi:hypothetical protein
VRSSRTTEHPVAGKREGDSKMTKIKHMAYSIAMLAMLALALGAPFKNS